MEKTPQYLCVESFIDNKAEFLTAEVLNELNMQNEMGIVNENNIILGILTHSFDTCQLPLKFDTIFNDRDSENCLKTEILIRGCFNYGKKFHTELWKGFNHLAIIEFEENVLEKINFLKKKEFQKRWDSNLIICNYENLENCRKFLGDSKNYIANFNKEHNPHIWESNEKEEFAFKKEKLVSIVEQFERGNIETNIILNEIFDLTEKKIDEFTLKNYWTSTSLNEFCETLLVKPIKDWQNINDRRALELIKEMLENTSKDGILQQNGEALEKRYKKATGFVIDLIFQSDIENKNLILEELKKDTTIYL